MFLLFFLIHPPAENLILHYFYRQPWIHPYLGCFRTARRLISWTSGWASGTWDHSDPHETWKITVEVTPSILLICIYNYILCAEPLLYFCKYLG